jgi:hypothetical protein
LYLFVAVIHGINILEFQVLRIVLFLSIIIWLFIVVEFLWIYLSISLFFHLILFSFFKGLPLLNTYFWQSFDFEVFIYFLSIR